MQSCILCLNALYQNNPGLLEHHEGSGGGGGGRVLIPVFKPKFD